MILFREFCWHRKLQSLSAPRRLAALMMVGILLLMTADAARADLASIFTNTAVRTSIARRPSIIFIQCHGLAFGDLSCYGQTNFLTPNLDQLAAQGIRFTQYAPGGTNPAAAETDLFSGGNPGVDGVPIARMLRNAGYKTGLIGEWPLVGRPWEQGFEEFAGFLNPDEGTNYYPDFIFRYDPRMYYNTLSNSWMSWQPGDEPNNGGREMIYQNTGGQKGRYLPDFMLAGWMQNFVRTHQPERFNAFRPFFLMVDLPAPRTATPGRDDFPVPTDAPYSDQPWPQAAKNRAAMLTRIDGDIGALIQQIDKFRLTNEVAIFFTSSAAPEKFANPGLDFLRTPADLLAETNNSWTAPMIVYWPGHIPAGQVSDYPWTARDFLPTAAQMAICPAPDNVTGQSILPVLLGQKTPGSP